ncbi:enoyl-CoA hydratase/isomerase family protein [Amycolatopsis sp. 3B14]|uniref:enoyl-CoA hydratase/isomerase family protein n=1 Tax=Amycolatopsis sp. 3B14 TaxID=3243600 RepID=UPI003D9634FF
MGRITVHRVDDVLVATIDTPGRLNAWTRAMRADLIHILERELKTDICSGAVITGAGEAFCAGQDFHEVATWEADTPWVDEIHDVYARLLQLDKPVVAAVNGVAAGSGFQLALLCDHRVAHAGVRMGQTEVRWGLASVVGTWFIERSLGASKARELALSGRLMEGEELLATGLIDTLAAPGQVVPAAVQACRKLAANPAASFRITKRWLYQNMAADMARVFRQAADAHRAGFDSGSSQQGADLFLHRKPA